MSARRRCLSILDQLADIICNQIESLQYQQLHSSLLVQEKGRNQIVYHQQPPSPSLREKRKAQMKITNRKKRKQKERLLAFSLYGQADHNLY